LGGFRLSVFFREAEIDPREHRKSGSEEERTRKKKIFRFLSALPLCLTSWLRHHAAQRRHIGKMTS